jgi:hypothetical protein
MRTTTTYAARRDGSTATIIKRSYSDSVGEHEIEVANIIDIPGRRMVRVDYGTRSTSTTPMTEQAVAHYMLPPDSSCKERFQISSAKTAIGPTETIFGQQAERVTQELEDSRIRRVRWFVPALDCLLVREVATHTGEDGQVTAHNVDLASLSVGDPDKSLFTVPSGYFERPYGEVLAESYRLGGKTMSDCEKRSVTSLDDSYAKRRAKK